MIYFILTEYFFIFFYLVIVFQSHFPFYNEIDIILHHHFKFMLLNKKNHQFNLMNKKYPDSIYRMILH